MGTKTTKTVMHPDSACCDLTQDLPGWIDRERARIARQYRWAKVLHARGRRLKAAAIKATVTGDPARADALDAQCREAHGLANAYAQRAMIREGHVDRVEEAHRWRPDMVNANVAEAVA